jgi:predicted MFS family arabinose efflux permease
MSGTSITYGASIVATNSLQQREFTEGYRATMGSIGSQVENVGMAVGALLLGLLADWVGVADALLVAQLLLIGVVVPYLLVLRQDRSPAR